jgi:alanyl-tRNA synthetase
VAQGASPAAGTRPEAPAVRAGDAVHGVIDWDRRFDHMQQHTGQHVLSAAFDKLFGVRTVSFHLGATVSTIDLAREMTAAEIAAAETEANRVVWEDRPVSIRFADAEEAARLPLRKESARGGVLRLIEVEGFDLSACGGTHVSRSGGIGVIAIAAWERFKGGQRLEFVCGARALAAYRTLRDAMTASIRLVSVLPNEVPGAIERLQAEGKERKRAISGLQADLSRYRAAELVAGGEPVGGCRLVARALDADASGLKNLASEAAAAPGMLVVLTSTVSPLLVVIARSADVTHSAQHLLTQLVAAFGGRGGGRSQMAQGGGLIATPEAVFDTIRRAIL